MSIARAEMESNTIDSTDKQMILDFIDASKQGILKGFIKNRGE
jgi:hypothetical protein